MYKLRKMLWIFYRLTEPQKYDFSRAEDPVFGVIRTQLHINHIDRPDFGVYRCKAHNRQGTISGYITLHGEFTYLVGSVVIIS